jgi:hypothetical protein
VRTIICNPIVLPRYPVAEQANLVVHQEEGNESGQVHVSCVFWGIIKIGFTKPAHSRHVICSTKVAISCGGWVFEKIDKELLVLPNGTMFLLMVLVILIAVSLFFVFNCV